MIMHGSGVLPSVARDELSSQVQDVLREKWVAPLAAPRQTTVPAGQVDALAKSTLDAMLIRRWRVTPWPADAEYQELLRRVRHWVARGKPIKVMLGYAPMKNPKTVSHTHADWSEFFALGHLCAWHNKICEAYPPGVRIKIIFDDSTVRLANQYAPAPMNEYIRSVGRLIRLLGYQPFIVGTMRQSSFAWLFHFGVYQLARRRVRRWEQRPANAETLDGMLQFARRNLLLPPGLSPTEAEGRLRDAAHRYRVYWEALQLSGFSRLGHKLIAMYMDGTQHHVRQEAALHLATIGKEQVVQPWQGEGALLDNGRGKLIPTVLTAGRREKIVSQRLTGIRLIPDPAFAAIEVCRERTPD